MSEINQNITCRLILKNIPENFSNELLLDLLNKNFENKLKEITITKLEHKYHARNNKFCMLTVDNLENRKKVFDFFKTFEMVDPKGFKQKLTVADCLFQNKLKNTKDTIEATIQNSKLILILS